MKRIICLVLALVCLLLACSCENTYQKDDETTKEYNVPTPVLRTEVSLPYIGTDSLDPYKATSVLNKDLLTAVFEGLFEPTSDGKGTPVIASSGEINGKTVTVKLRQDIKFSDSSPLTAQNVKTSFELAKNSTLYSAELSNVSSLRVDDNYSLTFTLLKYSDFALNALSFPIVLGKSGSHIGTGAFKFATLNNEIYLESNEFHESYTEKSLKQIALYDMAGASGAVYSFKANDISVYKNDLGDGDYSNLSPKTVSVPTNKLVFAGVNMTKSSSLLSIKELRNAINVGINRNEIAASSFLGQCSAAVTPYKAEVYVDDELAGTEGSSERAAFLLENSGFGSVKSDGVRTNGSTSLYVSVLVCSDNKYKVGVAEALSKSLESLGFSVTVNKKNEKDYLEALKKGNFDIYIGETELTNDFDLSGFFTKDGALSYGIDTFFFDNYTSYREGKTTLSEFVESFYTETPLIPLFYRNAILSYNPSLEGVEGSYRLYKNAASWSFSSKE